MVGGGAVLIWSRIDSLVVGPVNAQRKEARWGLELGLWAFIASVQIWADPRPL